MESANGFLVLVEVIHIPFELIHFGKKKMMHIYLRFVLLLSGHYSREELMTNHLVKSFSQNFLIISVA